MSQQPTANKSKHVIAICGNPNCGKTTIFNHITGLNQHVGNYPGVTVERIIGQFSLPDNPSPKYSLVDIPGTYSLAAFTPDEYIAASVLFGEIKDDQPPDVIIAVLDATNLERSFYLLLQILQTKLPVVVAVNMIDIAGKRGIHVDYEKLSQTLGGIPVLPVVGSKGIGVEQLKEKAIELLSAKTRIPEKIYASSTEELLEKLKANFGDVSRSRAHYARIIFDVHGEAEKRFIKEEGASALDILEEGRKKIIAQEGFLSQAETKVLTNKSDKIYAEAITKDSNKDVSRTTKIDKVILHPVLGPILLILMMYFVFQSIFSWAEPLMNSIDGLFGFLASVVESSMVEGPLRSLITDGIIGGVGSVLVFIPQIVILFLFIALLEDSGYMPRAAFLVDRMFRWCGLSGKSFIPMLSSFACAVPGIMATRTIEDKKLRFITIMVAPLMTCSARLPVYTIMISAFLPYKTYYGFVNLQGLTLTLLYLLGIVVAVIVSFILKKTLFKTEIGTFLMELPSYKIPTAKSILIRVFNRAKQFVIRAGTVIMAITIIIWALSYYPHAEDTHILIASKNIDYQDKIDASNSHNRSIISSYKYTYNDQQNENSKVITATIDSLLTVENSDSLLNELQILYPENSKEIDAYLANKKLVIATTDSLENFANEIAGFQIRNSYLGVIGKSIEPIFEPLGWDWKITVSVLASFPAREVIIAVLGTIYNLGSDIDEESSSLVEKMRQATWEDGDKIGQPVFTVAVAVSIMVFFALCCQCGATLVTIKQETGKWIYPAFVFIYMTTLAYFCSFLSYQILTFIGL